MAGAIDGDRTRKSVATMSRAASILGAEATSMSKKTIGKRKAQNRSGLLFSVTTVTLAFCA